MINDESVTVVLAVYLILLSLGLWWFLRSIVKGMSRDIQPALRAVTLSARALAALAFISVLVIVPLAHCLVRRLERFERRSRSASPNDLLNRSRSSASLVD